MRKCSKCQTEMIETKRKVKPVLIHMGINTIIIVILSIISIEYNLNNLLFTLIFCIPAVNLLLNFIALIVDGIVRYECPKCGNSKQRISIFRTTLGFLLELITDIFS